MFSRARIKDIPEELPNNAPWWLEKKDDERGAIRDRMGVCIARVRHANHGKNMQDAQWMAIAPEMRVQLVALRATLARAREELEDLEVSIGEGKVFRVYEMLGSALDASADLSKEGLVEHAARVENGGPQRIRRDRSAATVRTKRR